MPGQAIVTIDSSQWQVSVANTYTEITEGLSGLTELPANTGMLFDLGAEYSGIVIDMSRMQFPLDIMFIRSASGVVGVLENVQPGSSPSFTQGARYFLEVNAGEAEGIEVGDSVNIQVTGDTVALFWPAFIGGIIVAGAALPMIGKEIMD